MAKYKVKDLPRIERPREKLMRYGPDKLSKEELLAIILRTGKKGMNVIDLATKIFQKFSNERLLNVTRDELMNFKGIGSIKACEILAVIELSKRITLNKKNMFYASPKDVWQELQELRNNKKENFVILYLDSRNQEVKKEIISIGTLNSSLVHPREVFEPAIRNSAAGIILSHNHPSNYAEPSEADIEVTEKLVAAGKILDIEVLDHVIVTKDYWYSFKENNLI